MGLRSMALETTLEVSSALLLAGVLWLWPALARRGPVTVGLRLLMVAALQVSTLGLVFVWVNRSQEFYSSWADLLGTNATAGKVVAVAARPARHAGHAATPGGQTTQTVAAARSATGLMKVLSSRPVSVAGLRPARAGQLRTVRFIGQVSGISTIGEVYVPAPAHRPSGPLPVIVVISDGAGQSAAQVATAAAAEIAVHQLPPAVVAVLPAAVAGPGSAGCLDVPDGPQAETFFTQDLPAALRQAYRVTSAPSGWAVVGGAGGSYCALQLATSPAGEFGAAVVAPGAYPAPPGGYGPGSGKQMIAGSPYLRQQQDLMWRLRNQPRPAVRLLIAGPAAAFAAGGQSDPLLALAGAPMRTSTLVLPAGPAPMAPVFGWLGPRLGTRA